MQRLSALVLLAALTVAVPQVAESADGGYRVTKTLAIGGDDGWDYVGVDSAARRVRLASRT